MLDDLLALPAILKIEDFLFKKHGDLFKKEVVKEKKIKGQKAVARAKMAKTIRFDGDFKELGQELKKLQHKMQKVIYLFSYSISRGKKPLKAIPKRMRSNKT